MGDGARTQCWLRIGAVVLGLAAVLGGSIAAYAFWAPSHWPTVSGIQRSRVVLRKRHLAVADLHGLDLHGLDLSEAVLTRSTITGCNLRLADLRQADLRGAYLGMEMQMRAGGEAHWLKTDLRGADLRGADLRDATLDGCLLEGALFDATTQWPQDFDLAQSGAVRR